MTNIEMLKWKEREDKMIVKETIFMGLIFVIWTMILCIVITEGNKQSMPIKVALALYGIFFFVWCVFVIASALWLITE